MVMAKICNSCGKNKKLNEFHIDRSKRDGRMTKCKECKRLYDKQKNDKKKFDDISKYKNLLRSGAKSKYGKNHICAVLLCHKKAELHHIDYDTPDEIIPLCRKHHSAIHRLNNLIDYTNKELSE